MQTNTIKASTFGMLLITSVPDSMPVRDFLMGKIWQNPWESLFFVSVSGIL